MAHPITNAQFGPQYWYYAVEDRDGIAVVTTPGEKEAMRAFFPWRLSADSPQPSGSDGYFYRGTVHPNALDPPWYVDGDTNVNAARLYAQCWVGSQKKHYVVVPQGNVDDPTFSQDLYVCDEFCSTATLLQADWASQGPGAPNPGKWVCWRLCNYVTPDFEGLVAYSTDFLAASPEDGIIRTFDYDGTVYTGTGQESASLNQDPGDNNREYLLFLQRGNPDKLRGRTSVSYLTGAGTFRYALTGANGESLYDTGAQPDVDPVAGGSWEIIGQPCYDFIENRYLAPVQNLTLSATGSFYQTSAVIKEITYDAFGIPEPATDLITFPCGTYDSGGEDFAKTDVRAVWVNGVDQKIYVWAPNLAPSGEEEALHGVIQYALNGTGGTQVADMLFPSGHVGLGGLGGLGELSLGPGFRAPWEI
jgi:hypothetical protein